MPVDPNDPDIRTPIERDPLTNSPRNAPVLIVPAGQKVAPRVSGLPADRRLTLQVKEDGEWERLGRFRTRDNGTATLPPFQVTSRGGYLLRIPTGNDRFKYLKIRTPARAAPRPGTPWG